MKFWSTFLHQIVSQFCFCLQDCIKIVRLFFSTNGLNQAQIFEANCRMFELCRGLLDWQLADWQ